MAVIRAYFYQMQTLPISKVKDRLNDLVDATADVAAGRVNSEEQIRAEFNVPTRDR